MPTGSEAFLELPLVLGFGPATGPTLKTALCHIRTLVGRRINTALVCFGSFFGTASRVGLRPCDRTHLKNGLLFDDAALCPVVGHSRPAVVASCTVCSGVFHHWIHHLWPQGAVPPGFNPLRRGWVYRPAPEAPRKGECRRGPRHFWNCLSCWASALRQDPP